MLDFFSTPWKFGTIGFGILSLALVGKVVIQNHTIGDLRDEIKICTANLTTSQDNEKRLEGAISDQNAAIKSLSDESVSRLAAANAELVEAKKQTRDAQMRAGALLKTPIRFAWRLTWGVLGSRYARFSSFVRGPAAIRTYLRGEWRGLGHNPLGAWSVLALLTLPLVMVATGLFANDDVAFRGLLAGHVSASVSEQLTVLHGRLFDVFLVLIGLHVAAIVFYVRFKREDLLGPMLHGEKTVDEQEESPAAEPVPAWRLVLALVLALAVLAGVLAAEPAPPKPSPEHVVPDW